MNEDCLFFHFGARHDVDLDGIRVALTTEADLLDLWWEPNPPSFHGLAVRGDPDDIRSALQPLGWVLQWPRTSTLKGSDLRQTISERLRSGAAAVRKRSAQVVEVATQKGRSAAASAADQFVTFKAEAIERILPECVVPAVLLPSGPGTPDFVCKFDFHDAIDALRRGRLVRPRIVAWAGRRDVDRERLGAVLREQFGTQFRNQKLMMAAEPDEATAVHLSRIDRLETARDKAGSRLETAFKVTATALGALLLVANPIADLLFLGIALFGGSSAVTGLFHQLRASSDLRAAEAALEKSREELERDLDVSSARFQAAINNIEIRLHPALQEILEAICELEAKPFAPAKADTGAPIVHPHLISPDYLEQIDRSYWPLIQSLSP